MIKVTQQYPAFGSNYGPGWIGFLSRRKDFIAAGIDWFSRWDEISGIPVSHTFNVIDEDLTVEAFESGVSDGSLESYLADQDVALLMRRPRLLGIDTARAIIDEAERRLGEPYNNALIAAMGMSNSLLGRGLCWLTGGRTSRWLCHLADRPNHWICSRLVWFTLNRYPYSEYSGVMHQPPYLVKPIDLFEDSFLFEPGAVELVPFTHPLTNA